jgi:hypothetical protein
MNTTKLLLSLTLLTTAASAQVLPAPGPAQPAPASNANSSGGGNNNNQSQNNSSMGGVLPHADTGNEMVTWDGKMWQVNNNRLVRSKFEIYLATPEANGAEDQAYRDIIAQIVLLLAPTRKGGPDVSAAFALLPEAGAFRIDAGLCNTHGERRL